MESDPLYPSSRPQPPAHLQHVLRRRGLRAGAPAALRLLRLVQEGDQGLAERGGVAHGEGGLLVVDAHKDLGGSRGRAGGQW